MNKRTLKNFQPEEKLNNEQKADKKQVSPAIANALVVGCQSLEYTETGRKIGASYTIRDRSAAIYTITNKSEYSDWEISSD